MLIELRASDDRLRGPKAVDAAPILTAAYRAATESPAELSRLRFVCDYIQYRQNFRDPVELRRVEPWNIDPGTPTSDGESFEIAIDLRRARPDAVDAGVKASLADAQGCARLPLESWGPGSRSLIWGFNTLYWKALSLWEQSTGKGYESAVAYAVAGQLGFARSEVGWAYVPFAKSFAPGKKSFDFDSERKQRGVGTGFGDKLQAERQSQSWHGNGNRRNAQCSPWRIHNRIAR